MPDNVFLNPDPDDAPKIGAAINQGYADANAAALLGTFVTIQRGNGGLHPKRAAGYLTQLDTIDEEDVDDEYWPAFDEYREQLREKLEARTIDRT